MAGPSRRGNSNAAPRSAGGEPPGNGPNSGREPALFGALAAGPMSHNPFNIPLK